MEKQITFGIASYNNGRFLEACLESVVSQKGDDIEIIIVDDGSTDGSENICRAFKERDKRIHVILKENGGVSSVRNLIIEKASGKYISFVDGDDLIVPGCAEIFRKYLGDNYDIINFDLLYFRFEERIAGYSITASGEDISGDELYKLAAFTIYNTEEEKKRYINKTILSSCGKLIKTEFLRENNLFFDENLRKAQDAEFNFRCLNKAKDIRLERIGTYLYRHNMMSATKAYNPKIKEYNLKLLQAFKTDIENADDRYKQIYKERFACLVTDTLVGCCALDLFHRSNKKSYAVRKKEFLNMLNIPEYDIGLKKCNTKILRNNDLKFYKWIKDRKFLRLDIYFKCDVYKNFVKSYLNKIGVTKFYKKIMKKH